MSEGDDWIDRLIDAFNAHDAVAVGEFMTDDVEYVMWQDAAWTRVGERHRVVDLLKSFDREFSSDFTLTKTFAIVTEHGFAVEYTEEGTQDRGSAPTGRHFSLRNVMVGELQSGRISRMTDYSDVVAYRAQMSPP